LLAPLAGRIYDHAPQQNAFPLDGATNTHSGTMQILSRLVNVALVLVVGCGSTGDVAALRNRTDSLEKRLDSLSRAMTSVDFRQRLHTISSDYEKVAFLTPGSDGYSILRADIGTLTVNLVDVQPYANGSRITLKIGNTTSASIDGAKATVEWGSVVNGMPENDSTKSRVVTIAEALESGRWTNVRVVLEGAPPAALGFVRIRDVTHSGIRLHR
jgi:hypothetical protein